MKVNSTHWLISAGILDYKGLPYKAPLERKDILGRVTQIRRTTKQMKNDTAIVLRLLRKNKPVCPGMYARLKRRGFLRIGIGGEFMIYHSFYTMCARLRTTVLHKDTETNTSKVNRVIKPGMKKAEIAKLAGITIPQVNSAIATLRKNKVGFKY